MFDPLRISKVKPLSEVVFYSMKIEDSLLSEESKSESDFDKKFWIQFDRLENLATQLQYTSEKSIIQCQQESLFILTQSQTFAASSIPYTSLPS